MENFDLHISKNMVKIISKNHNNVFNESSGFRISENTILASAHAVRDADSIVIDEKKFYIISLDEYQDIAILWENKHIKIPEKIFTNYNENEVFAFVMRDGKWQKIFGKIVDKNIEINALAINGKMEKIFIKNLTDLSVWTGDSGTPIFWKNYEIIDIVHTDNFLQK